MPVKIDEDECVQCGTCIETCSEGAITGEAGETPKVDASKCKDCGDCISECPSSAITKEE
jgi:ferredoxin